MSHGENPLTFDDWQVALPLQTELYAALERLRRSNTGWAGPVLVTGTTFEWPHFDMSVTISDRLVLLLDSGTIGVRVNVITYRTVSFMDFFMKELADLADGNVADFLIFLQTRLREL